MHLVKLTLNSGKGMDEGKDADKDDPESVIFMNPQKILFVNNSLNGCARLWFSLDPKDTVFVTESPDEVVKLMNQAFAVPVAMVMNSAPGGMLSGGGIPLLGRTPQ
jgi:hypothetical protein